MKKILVLCFTIIIIALSLTACVINDPTRFMYDNEELYEIGNGITDAKSHVYIKNRPPQGDLFCFVLNYLLASSIATATATVMPTMGLLPAPTTVSSKAQFLYLTSLPTK